MKLLKTIKNKISFLWHTAHYHLSGRRKYFLITLDRIKATSTQKQLDLLEVELVKKLKEPGLLRMEEASLQVAKGLLDIRRDNL